MENVKAVFLEKIYPKDEEDDDYKIVKYMVTEDPSGSDVPYEIKVKGYGIPEHYGAEFILELNNKEENEFGVTYTATNFTVDVPKTELGMKFALVKAAKVFREDKFNYFYGKYKERLVFNLIFDDKILKDPNITDVNIKAIRDFKAFVTLSFVKSIFTAYGLNLDIVKSLYTEYKEELIKILKTDPHMLVMKKVVPFNLAEGLVKKYNLKKNTKNRFLAIGLEVLRRNEQGGNFIKISGGSCIEYNKAVNAFVKIADIENIDTKKHAYNVFTELQKRNLVVPYMHKDKVYLYNADCFKSEVTLSDNIKKFLSEGKINIRSLDKMIQKKEKDNGFTLAPEQRKAVMEGLTNKITVITGGPGTGKTTIINFIRSLMKSRNKNANILLCAPTGMAARRMTASTGFAAYTMHSAMNIKPPEEGNYIEIKDYNKLSNYDAIIVDEFSMVDMYLADAFFRAIDTSKKVPTVILIGDVNQLPSVGAGNVLSDIIQSVKVPTVILRAVYRQSSMSRIAVNASLICSGHTNLETGDDFKIIEKKNEEDSVAEIKKLYALFVNQYGAQNVSVLSPFRTRRSKTGTESLNIPLQKIANSNNGKVYRFYGKEFVVGDRVMQSKTKDEIANGDIGVISNIKDKSGHVVVEIDFGDLGIVEYEKKDMKFVQPAYATTIHKSQGSEYKIVIMAISEEHSIMLKRNLVYTGITRAKEKVFVVGSKKALDRAILTAESKQERRLTFLSERIRQVQK